MRSSISKENEAVANSLGIRVLKGNKETKNKVGLHLLSPDTFDMSYAIENAERDMFDTIYVYEQKTWNNRKE